MKYKVLDLFSGAGGMSLGFKRAGFEIILSIDNNKEFSETYIKNFKNTDHLIKDIKLITDDEINLINKKYPIDIIIGGPPCQGFSMAGNIGRKFINDERNMLFIEFFRFVKIIKPKIFIIENVSRILIHKKGETISEIQDYFNSIGYEIKYKSLNSYDYEVPQKRNRAFIVGTPHKNNYSFPKKRSKKINIIDVLKDIPEPSIATLELYNHTVMKHSEQMLEKMSYVKEGGDRSSIPEYLRPLTGDVRKYIRLDRNKPSYCVTGDMRKIFHFEKNRAFTSRELACIQTFPKKFIFCGNSISVQQQIGNAVPPKLAFFVAKSIKEYLDEK